MTYEVTATERKRAVRQRVAVPRRLNVDVTKLLKAVAVVLVIFFGWRLYKRYLAPPSPAYQAYQHFADAMAREKYDDAAALATGAAKNAILAIQQRENPAPMHIYGRTLSMKPPSISEIAGEVDGIRFKLVSEQSSGDGEALEVLEAVNRTPPGVTSAMNMHWKSFRHHVKMVQEGQAWHVSEFAEEPDGP